MFSTRNGLYDRARRRFKIQDGIKLFTYSFYKQRREEVQVRATLLSTLCDCWVKQAHKQREEVDAGVGGIAIALGCCQGLGPGRRVLASKVQE